jgi:1-acyl-sn-glycerol-3-phosphate acyltransferase
VGLESDRFVLRAVTDEIMYALMELSGQEYVDEDAQHAKAALKAERKVHASTGGQPGT